MPSQLRAIFADFSYYDLKTKIELRTQEKMAEVHQAHETLVIVISQALGGKTEEEQYAKTPEELEARLSKVFG